MLLSAHICHPSLANDNCSGMAVLDASGRALGAVTGRATRYRFLFAPGTIGAITWLARNEDAAPRIRHGLVVSLRRRRRRRPPTSGAGAATR